MSLMATARTRFLAVSINRFGRRDGITCEADEQHAHEFRRGAPLLVNSES